GGLKGAGKSIAAWRYLPVSDSVETNLSKLEAFMAEQGLDYPVVLKPDAGARGSGVGIIKDREAARDYLERAVESTIAQAFVPGLEFGVFYYRYPGESNGHILGITDKRFPQVTGDGENTLEHLILYDERGVGMADFFLDKFDDRLDDVPAKGEVISLTELGTHCRGSLFLDGSHLATPELTAALDEISSHFKGFDFGRYDIRVPSVEDLQAGRNLKVIELNGLTSEATYIYDPKHSYFFGLKTLCRQWRIAFEIAAINHRNGHPHMSTRRVFHHFFDTRSRERLEV
ncbi:MAG: hypothetical protein ACQKBW_00725, partial [Puniceicoccales bacterium]